MSVQMKQILHKDARMKLTNQVLTGVKVSQYFLFIPRADSHASNFWFYQYPLINLNLKLMVLWKYIRSRMPFFNEAICSTERQTQIIGNQNRI